MGRLDLSFFNTFAASLDGQPITHYPCLLVYLALNRDRAIPRDVLATLFWPEETEKSARHSLRQALYHLRIQLGDTKNNGEPFLNVTHRTAAFNSNSDYCMDVDQFLHAIEMRNLATAVQLYQGDLLPGFACDSLQFENWLRQERESLHHLALEAMSELTQDHLAAGCFEQAQVVARQQLNLEPWREQAFRQLMRAYALAGDRSNALAVFEACRETLREELSIEPEPETLALFEEIAAGRYAGSKNEALQPPLRLKHNLPADTTPLIGRELELSQINRLITQDRQRLVTIVGPGGMGKTRLALAVGSSLLQSFEDGVYFVDLTPLNETQEIPPAIAGALNYQAPDVSRALRPQLLETLRRRNLLLILDNFEHLPGGALLVDEILKICPQVTLLTTSRQLLNLASESRFDLEGLELPESLSLENALGYSAVQFFVDSSGRAHPGFALTADNVADVVQICRQVQGMPLGILLAAAWLGLLSPKEIASEIEKSLEFLSADLADLPPRQRSMLAVFKRSWEMMAPAEQEVLANLSVFRGGFSREAAEEVAGANLRILLSLVNKSLLQRKAESGRFVIHELLRQYAADWRRKADPEDHALLAHCMYYARVGWRELRRSLHCEPYLLPVEDAADWANYRRAWDYALEHGLAFELSALSGAVTVFLVQQGVNPAYTITDASERLQQLDRPSTNAPMLYLHLLELRMCYHHGLDSNRLNRMFQEIVAQINGLDSLEIRFWILEGLWETYLHVRSNDLLLWSEKMVQVATEMQDEPLTNLAESCRIRSRVVLGLHDKNASTQLQELLVYFEPNFSNSYALLILCLSLSELFSASKEYDQAVHFGVRALKVTQYWQHLFWMTFTFDNLVHIYLQMNLRHEAGQQILRLLEWHLAIGQEWQTIGALLGFARKFSYFVGGNEKATAITSMVFHHPEAIPPYKREIGDMLPKLKMEMGDVSFAKAWAEGKEMDMDSAIALVRAELASFE